MELTGKQIIENGIVTNTNPECIQQQGVDCEIMNISRLVSTSIGIIPKEGKTVRPLYETIIPNSETNEKGEVIKQYWVLGPGWYDIELNQGINMQDKYKGYFKTRSSLLRCGAIIHSGLFDAGFTTERAGCFLEVKNIIKIEKNARVAQFIVSETPVVENLYNGQWQNDNQRNK